jgi:hypothetical protein
MSLFNAADVVLDLSAAWMLSGKRRRDFSS